MNYDFIAIPDNEIPAAAEPIFQHVVTTYVSEANKTVSMWRAVPDDLLDFKPHEKTNSIRTIVVHQLLSERRFFRNSSARKSRPSRCFSPRANTHRRMRTSKSTFGLFASGFRSSPRERPLGGLSNGLSSAA